MANWAALGTWLLIALFPHLEGAVFPLHTHQLRPSPLPLPFEFPPHGKESHSVPCHPVNV